MSRKTKAIQNSDAPAPRLLAQYRVITTRGPFWNGASQPENAIISADEGDPAILDMEQRNWLVRVERVKP